MLFGIPDSLEELDVETENIDSLFFRTLDSCFFVLNIEENSLTSWYNKINK